MKANAMLKSLSILGLALALGIIPLEMRGGVGAKGPGDRIGVGAALGTAFSYQGRLTDGGSPAISAYDFQFKLYDAASGGNQVGDTVTKVNVTVTEGLFAVQLDFGPGVFTGDARYLEISVRTGNSPTTYTTLTPRQELTPVPYALALPGVFPLHGNVGIGTTSPSRKLTIESSTGDSIYLKGNTGGRRPHTAALLTLESNMDFRGRGMFLPHRDASDQSDRNAWFVGVPYRGGGFQIGNSTIHLEENPNGPYTKEMARLFIAEDGNVGIGTTNPAALLHVAGRMRTGVLEITGGSDLAEPFEIVSTRNIEPGMVVAIDPEHPGQLRIADKAYDRTVAGCVSGAKGVNPGLTMQQEGTVADGAFPVALSGRVYCWADASYGAIQPGDLLTTSDTPGHVMKVADYVQAQGAIIGKAMSALTEGQNLILVLVSLQ